MLYRIKYIKELPLYLID